LKRAFWRRRRETSNAARKKYSRALKIFADGADNSTVLGSASRNFLFPPFGGPSPLELRHGEIPLAVPELLPGTDVRPETNETQIRSARPTVLVPRVSTHGYTIHIDADDPLVKQYVALYSGRLHERTQAAFDRMGRYLDMVTRAIEEENMPRELIYLPVVESEYQPFAVSRAGAEGMWQFMSGTAKYAGLKVNYWVDERRDPEKSTRAALRTLKSLYDWFDDWHLALAAYNRGIYGIQRDLEFTRSPDFALLAKRQGIPLETEQYVPKLMALVIIGDNAEAYGLPPPETQSIPFAGLCGVGASPGFESGGGLRRGDRIGDP
jgi:hypothetical protein